MELPQRHSLIPSEVDLAGAELELSMREDRLEIIRNALAPVKESGAFDYIILDCPPSLGIVMTSSLVASDGVLIPIQAEFLAMDGLALITGSIERIRSAANPSLDLNGIVFTMVNSQAKLTQDVISEVRGHFGDKVYETLIPRNVRTRRGSIPRPRPLPLHQLCSQQSCRKQQAMRLPPPDFKLSTSNFKL